MADLNDQQQKIQISDLSTLSGNHSLIEIPWYTRPLVTPLFVFSLSFDRVSLALQEHTSRKSTNYDVTLLKI